MTNGPEHDPFPTRPSLLGRLRDWEDRDSWQEFTAAYGPLIRATARRAGLSESDAEEVIQETFLAVARNIGTFRYAPARCSFKSWLLLITRQRIIWQFRRRIPGAAMDGSGSEGSSRTATIERIADEAEPALDAIWQQEWQVHLLTTAQARTRQRVSARQFQMFDLYVLQGWPAREVARTLKVSVAQVYLAKHRVGRLLRKEVSRLEREEVWLSHLRCATQGPPTDPLSPL